MSETSINVELLALTPNAEEMIESAGRTAYLSFDKKALGTDKKFVEMILRRGHESVIEHAFMSIRITGVSRAMTHQLVRHRLCSYTQQSQRYVNEKNFNYIIPERIKNDALALKLFNETLDKIKFSYKTIQSLGIPNEDARFILPNACESQIVVTANLREWRHILELRGSPHAQWEIRKMAVEVYKILNRECPTIVLDFKLTERGTLEKISLKNPEILFNAQSF